MVIDSNVLQAVRPSRRSVVRGAAWSVPVVSFAATAPAFSASVCSTPLSQTMTWNVNRGRRDAYGYRRTDNTSASYLTQDPDGNGPLKPLQVDISVSYGDNVKAAADQLYATTQNVGGTASPGLTLHQTPRSIYEQSSTLLDRNKSVVTFAFSQTVSSLTFTMTDIDSASSDFRDAVGIAGATVSNVSIVNPAQVTGAGSVSDPFRVVPTNSAVDNFTENGGNVTVTLSEFSSFEIHYWNFQPYGSGGDQKVYLTNFQAAYYPC
jgi:hypothetical protein